MKEDYKQVAVDLLDRLGAKSKPTDKAITTFPAHGLHLIVNNAEHCTFILGAPPGAAGTPPPMPPATEG